MHDGGANTKREESRQGWTAPCYCSLLYLLGFWAKLDIQPDRNNRIGST